MNLATELKFNRWIKTCKRLGIGIAEDMSEMSLDDAFRVIEEMEQKIAELNRRVQWLQKEYDHFIDALPYDDD